jgi:hypothetical protein
MANTTLTFDEMLDSITGYDEIGIKQISGQPFALLLQADPIHGTRCAIAVHLMREAKQDGPKALKEHYATAMKLPMGEVRAYFEQPVEEFDPTSPDSESGKGD